MDPLDTTQNDQPSMLSHGVKWGLITASIGIILTIIWYVVDYALLGDWKIGLLSIAIYIGLLIYTGITYRNEVGGFLSYGKAFQYTMIVVIVSGIVTTIFNLLLYQVINPELGAMVTDAAVQNQEEMMRSMGAPESSIEQGVADARTRMENQFTVGGQLLGTAFILGGGAILALLTSLVVRKNQPMEM
jgi:hypothetical protein